MSSLYDEAIADAKELVRMAEENATNKLIDAVAPRIRKIVERRLVKEASTNEDDDIESIITSLDSDEIEDEQLDQVVEPASSEEDFDLDDEEYTEDEPSIDDEFGSMDIDSLSPDSGMAQLPLKGVKKINIEFESERMLTDEGVELTNESINTLLGIIDGKSGLLDRIREARMELRLLGRALSALNESRTSKIAAIRIVENFNSTLRKAIGFQGEITTLTKGKLRESSAKELHLLLKEIKIMSTRSLLRTLLEREERKSRLREADEAEVEAADGEEVVEAEAEVDVDAVKAAIESLASAVGMQVAAEEGAAEEEDMDAPADKVDMEEGVYELDEMEMEMEMAHEMEMEAEMPMESRRRTASNRRPTAKRIVREAVYTIDETMLRRELRRLRALREGDAGDMADNFGGAKSIGDQFEDPTELNALDEADDTEEKEEKVKEAEEKKDKEMKEARKNRALTRTVSEAVTMVNDLRRELAEQKLFNTKLLYVNKLMQNRSLSERHLKSIVEALDSAKTLREANLLYKSLTESLTRSTSALSESTNRTVGNSSRSTRSGSASNLNESVEVDRWAILAGIGNRKA